ncbi:DNA-binding response regulator [Paraliobacillus quinghaiensis]|uniref:DNA-binding response regulator n=1 Tax=Paraliobacillus quinghaiensis TaxID=470815 RepID=A0A917WYS3_9BACI|nr:response regulator [Paraliobacillus quinghaiensis]GGM42598.1 DNA-binding response regulator [Paraliobacillus quinghaiensis]
MIKLLIVDNEQVEREGMQAILQKGFPEIVIEQAKNGKHAIEVTDEFKPDVVLMDIKMPGINGLEAVEQIIEKHPNIKCIMVTAYDTFDFVRQAIKLGAKDYLLKPSKASEILETVGKIFDQVIKEQESLITSKLQQEKLQKTLALAETDVVTQLLFDHVHEVHLDILVEMLGIKSMNQMFVTVVLIPSGSEHLYSSIKQKVRKMGNSWVGALYGNQLPIIVFRNTDKSFRSQATILAREILTLAKNDQRSGWFIGIGSVCDSLERIRQSYQDALMATMDTTLPVKYRFYSDLPAFDDARNVQQIKEQEKEFFDQIRLGHWEQVRTNIMNLIQYYENEGANIQQTQQKMLEVLWIASQVMNEIGIEIVRPFYAFQVKDYQQLRSVTGQLLDGMQQSYVEHNELLEADTIHQIKQFIIEHSHEDISLEALGEKVELSPIYISKMFKEKLGVNYIDFLTACRIEKAKKLMGDPEKSIKEITFEVGYHEPNYFSKVFKKMTNLSPKEYRKKLQGKTNA